MRKVFAVGRKEFHQIVRDRRSLAILLLFPAFVLLLFGYQKLPDAARSLGRSLRIFRGEMRGMHDDGRAPSAGAASGGAGERLP